MKKTDKKIMTSGKEGPFKVLVAGELIWDNNLVQHPSLPSSHHESFAAAVLHRRPGGAWYLKDMVFQACSDLISANKAKVIGPKRINATKGINQAYQVWTPFNTLKGSKEKVWRINQFLGCQTLSKKNNKALEINIQRPDVLVLDNLGLGLFSESYEEQARLIKEAAPAHVIMKISSLPDSQEILKRLNESFAERLTIILSVQALRDRGANISQGLSWDRTIEEIEKEFREGVSASDLARCQRTIVTFGHEGVASVKAGKPERFLYHPREHEGALKALYPGITFGASSIVAAAMTRHVLDPATYPLFIALGRALAASRENRRCGGGPANRPFNSDAAHGKIKEILNWNKNTSSIKKEPAQTFSTTFAHDLLSDPCLRSRPFCVSDLLCDVTGKGYEYVSAVATDIVLRGADQVLSDAPMARYGFFQTADREEIERINAVRNLLMAYCANQKDEKPLSIAVFGPPGSGKSFAIKQLAEALFGSQKRAVKEFNLSQFGDISELHEAFHEVRDASIQGAIPLVFWDEFDSDGLKWLKDFLAPMQDACFTAGSVPHPFGKAIFIFAGGTKHTFEAFRDSGKGNQQNEADPSGAEKSDAFNMKKGPDFISRLRGFVNIKGPNPETGPDKEPSNNSAYLVRRAILLRSLLERLHPQLLDKETGRIRISASVVRGFLRVQNYLHGARSMEAIVKMSNLVGVKHFGAAALPDEDMLSLHVSGDFLEKIREGQLGTPLMEIIAQECHRAWYEQKKADGYEYGKTRNDKGSPKTHPLLVDYAMLSEDAKEGNRITARLTQAKLAACDFMIKADARCTGKDKVIKKFSREDQEKLMDIEHDIWLRRHLLEGYDYAETTNEDLLLHRDIARFDQLDHFDQQLDKAIVDSLIPALNRNGYKLVRVDLKGI